MLSTYFLSREPRQRHSAKRPVRKSCKTQTGQKFQEVMGTLDEVKLLMRMSLLINWGSDQPLTKHGGM